MYWDRGPGLLLTLGSVLLIQSVFLVLKMTGAIDWNWWIILIPSYLVVAWVLMFIAGAIGFNDFVMDLARRR